MNLFGEVVLKIRAYAPGTHVELVGRRGSMCTRTHAIVGP